jgi:hypothetical protein
MGAKVQPRYSRRRAASQGRKPDMAKDTLSIEVVFNGRDCLVIANGLKIAKRGVEKNWIPLEPGWTVVYDPYDPNDAVKVWYEGARVH